MSTWVDQMRITERGDLDDWGFPPANRIGTINIEIVFLQIRVVFGALVFHGNPSPLAQRPNDGNTYNDSD